MNNHTLTRQDLAQRWKCSVETIKRKEKAGYLIPFRLGERFIRYRIEDILILEEQALSQNDSAKQLPSAK